MLESAVLQRPKPIAFRVLDASGKVGWVSRAEALVEADLRVHPNAVLTNRIDAIGTETDEAVETFTSSSDMNLLGASAKTYFAEVTDQGAAGPFDDLRVPWMRVAANGVEGWLPPLEVTFIPSVSACRAALPPRGLIRIELGLADKLQSEAAHLIPTDSGALTLLEPFDAKRFRSMALSPSARCDKVTALYYPSQRPRGSGAAIPSLGVLSCTNPDGEFEFFDALFARGNNDARVGYVIQPEAKLRVVRVEESQAGAPEDVLFVEVGSQTSHDYNKVLLALSPLLPGGFSYYDFGDDDLVVNWVSHRTRTGVFVVGRNDNGTMRIKSWTYAERRFSEQPAYLAVSLERLSLLQGRQAALNDGQAVLIPVEGLDRWSLAWPAETLETACSLARKHTGTVVADGDSLVAGPEHAPTPCGPCSVRGIDRRGGQHQPGLLELVLREN